MIRIIPTTVFAVFLAALTACSSTSITPTLSPQATAPTPPPPVAQVDIASLPGNYGLASYHREQDLDRTIKQAKIACRNPYKIDPGSNGGVVMHAPGQSGPAEFFLKKDDSGQSYLGPKGPAGGPNDQRVVSYQDRTLVAQWTSGRLRSVYGTMVYVPCAQT
ncbi:MAG: hypothetical protein ACR2PF_05785 [Rhizobiaceae bacterium]